MALINQYSSIDALAAGDVFPVFDQSNGDTRKISATALANYVLAQLSTNLSGYTTQYSAPSVTGFTVAVTDSQNSIHLILTPTGTMLAGTITLPLSTNCLDGQSVLVNCTQAITTLTINANGATSLTGAPTTLAANAFFTLKYDKPTSTWYRVG